jgi:hypothetical protein
MRAHHHHRVRPAAALAALGGLIAAAGGCEVPRCNRLIETGRTYAATVLGRYAETDAAYVGPQPAGLGGAPPCGAADGLVPGAGVALRATAWDDRGTCAAAVGEISVAPAAVTLEGAVRAPAQRSALLSAESRVRFGGCAGLWLLQYFRTGNDLEDAFADPAPGGRPPVVLLRSFTPSPLADPPCALCADYVAVKLHRPDAGGDRE